MLNRLSFNRKITLITLSATLGLVVVCSLSIWQTRSDIHQGKQAALRIAALSALSIVTAFKARAAAGTMPEAEAKKAARDVLRATAG